MKFSVCNLGCKVNAFEAESIAAEMEKKGWQRVPFEEAADAALIFTCAVTNMAAQKSRKMMHRARRLNPDAVIAMVGCYAEVDEGKIDDAEIVIGTREKKNLPDYIDRYLKDHQKVRVTGDLEKIPFDNMETEQFENRTRAYLKVQDGCNQFCSYCVIPYARGRERSMDPDAVIKEARRLAEHYPEIVLAGIHTGRYGRGMGITLAGLMKRLMDEVPALERLRISSIEVSEIDDELIDLMKKEKRIARHLHIPLQSGSDTVLSRMRRPYNTAEYYARIEKIRSEIPDISISCDLIVGFPMESDEEFEETCAFLEKCRFSFLHVFQYSMRRGTPAAEMPCQIDPRIKKQRMQRCVRLSEDLYDRYQAAWVGREADVILESAEGDAVRGHSSQYFPVWVRGAEARGGMKHVRLVSYENHRLYGEICTEAQNETE